MPTLFLHLPLAAQAAERLALPESEVPAFLWGSVAPDAAQRHGLPREQTHFWTTRDDVSGALRLLTRYPHLRADALSAAERAFVGGYLCHLVADEQWTFCIWRPYFGRHSRYGGSAEGAAMQHAFRTVVDERERTAGAGLAPLGDLLDRAATVELRGDLLPFVDAALLVVEREIAADRARHGPSLAPPPAASREEAIAYVRDESFAEFRARAVEESVRLVGDYLAGRQLRPPRGTADPAATSAT